MSACTLAQTCSRFNTIIAEYRKGNPVLNSVDTQYNFGYCSDRLDLSHQHGITAAMKYLVRHSLIITMFCLFAVGLAGCSGKSDSPLFLESKRKSGDADAPVKDVPTDILSTQKAFSNVSKKVTPSVVNISTVSRKKMVQPFFEMNPFFEDFFGAPQTRRDKSLGSGFLISKDGYIVTNDHVVRDAESCLLYTSPSPRD